MKKQLQLLILFLILGINTVIFAQKPQSNFINYQGVASNASGEVMASQNINVKIALKFGATTVPASYIENHSITTDTNGVFSLEIGNGTATSGVYDPFNWGGIAVFVTVSINSTEIGTTEMLAVPYAITAGNTFWNKEGDDIENYNTGLVKVLSNLKVGGNIQLQLGPAANEISTDGTLSGNSDKAIPTEKAVKIYIDGHSSNVKKIDDLSDAKSDNNGLGNGSSLFLGLAAGANDDGTDNKNVGVGLQALHKNLTGSENTAFGYVSLMANIEGNRNSAIGYGALNKNLSGSNNTANGHTALLENTIGSHNTAIGNNALLSNQNGNNNTATGSDALYKNEGSNNTANGRSALLENFIGGDNTAVGSSSLRNNTHGSGNTANGVDALRGNSSGDSNTAIGFSALLKNSTGSYNTSTGTNALQNNIAGAHNTANGSSALLKNTSGSYNTASGNNALYNKVSGSWNTAMGNDALNDLQSGNNNIGIGADAQVPSMTGSHQVRIGNNQITYAGIQVAWTITSDAAWKDDIQPLPYGLTMVSQLKPVDYIRINNEANKREIGFIAQDIEMLLKKLGYTNSGMLTTDDDGRLSLRYNDFIPILTKAVQELNDKTTALKKMNDQLLQRIEALENK